jgi:hypothetical protein
MAANAKHVLHRIRAACTRAYSWRPRLAGKNCHLESTMNAFLGRCAELLPLFAVLASLKQAITPNGCLRVTVAVKPGSFCTEHWPSGAYRPAATWLHHARHPAHLVQDGDAVSAFVHYDCPLQRDRLQNVQ